MKLSERLRACADAAPWVIVEVIELEAIISKDLARATDVILKQEEFIGLHERLATLEILNRSAQEIRTYMHERLDQLDIPSGDVDARFDHLSQKIEKLQADLKASNERLAKINTAIWEYAKDVYTNY